MNSPLCKGCMDRASDSTELTFLEIEESWSFKGPCTEI